MRVGLNVAREKFSTWLPDFMSMQFYLKRHSALQWGWTKTLLFKRLKTCLPNIYIPNVKFGVEVQPVSVAVLGFQLVSLILSWASIPPETMMHFTSLFQISPLFSKNFQTQWTIFSILPFPEKFLCFHPPKFLMTFF